MAFVSRFIQRRALLAIVSLLLAAGLLTACDTGSSTPTIAPPTPTPAPSEQDQPTPGGAGVTPQSGSMPSDFSVVYEWRAGSMPPPYHYEYVITVGPGPKGTIVYSPSYPGQGIPKWTETFDLTDAQMTSLYDVAVKHNILRDSWLKSEPSVGGSAEWAEIDAGGKHYSIPSEVAPTARAVAGYMYDAVKALVPQTLWDKLEAQRQQWADSYKK